VTLALAFTAGVALAWLCLRVDPRVAELTAELAAAERDLRIATGSRRIGVRQPGPFPLARVDTDGLCPTDEWLAEWDMAVDGMTWWHPWGQQAHLRTEIDDLGAAVHRIVPDRPSTAMIRRIVCEAAA
jgi:hypothetical protein